MPLRTVTATRYVTPLREGGSLPAVVEADDDGLYVVKFTGAGQGPKVLAAEVVCGELGRRLGLPVPELVQVELDPQLATAEPDPEIQDLLRASAGLNLGVDYLPGSLPHVDQAVAPDLAALVVWFDALVANVDRTPRNPNLLWWVGDLWCIDHGAALTWHFADRPSDPAGAFPAIRDHVLKPQMGALPRPDVPRALLDEAAALVPAAWSSAPYADWLAARLRDDAAWRAEAERG